MPNQIPKIVLDVNVLVSSLINKTNPPGRIRTAWREQKLQLIISPPILKKLNEVLHRPHIINVFPITEADIQALLQRLQEYAIITPHLLHLKVVEQDPEDDTIIIAAVEGKADYIISGDRHLKNLGTYQNIPILSPSEFVKQQHHDL